MALPYPPINVKPVENNKFTASWLFFIKGIFNITGSGVGNVFFNETGIESVGDLYINPSAAGTIYIHDAAFNAPASTDVGKILSYDGTNFTYLQGGVDVGIAPTGTLKMGFFGTSLPSGWILLNDGTIGNATSGASNRANADTEALYTLLWTNISNTYCPVSGGRGASAAADFAAGKTLTLPPAAGRAVGCAGAGSGLTSRSVGNSVGEETHILTTAELPSHTHNIDYYPYVAGQVSANEVHGTNTLGGEQSLALTRTSGANTGGNSHNNMAPTTFLNTIIRL